MYMEKMLPAGSSHMRFKDFGNDSQLPSAGNEVLNASIEVTPEFIFSFSFFILLLLLAG